MKLFRGLAISATFCAALECFAFVETFDNGSNIGGWTFGTSNGRIEPTGGNPGAFYHDPLVDTFAPQPHTTGSSIFTGNYRASEVAQLGIDVAVFHVDFSAGNRPLSLILVSDGNTPGDPNDDWGAFVMNGQNIPIPGEGWRHFDFAIDANSATLPAGWEFIEFGPNAMPNWAALITDVDQVRYFFGDPRNFFIFQQWDVGIDNASIGTVPEPATICMLCAGVIAARRRLAKS